jgi:hypothetical protein
MILCYQNNCLLDHLLYAQFNMEIFYYFRFPCLSNLMTQKSYFPAPLEVV